MGLFARRPQVSESTQYFTIGGLQKTLLIVGLGNPGKEYDGTRHNIGFECLDNFVRLTEEMGEWNNKPSMKCQLASGQIGQTRVIVIKPSTFMNHSGEAVQAVAGFYKIPPEHIALVHDELDIAFGQIRTRQSGSSAGHNGVKSVTQHLGENTWRVRIGVGPKNPLQIDASDYVLGKFSSKEKEQLPNLRRETTALLSEYVYGGQLHADTRSFLV